MPRVHLTDYSTQQQHIFVGIILIFARVLATRYTHALKSGVQPWSFHGYGIWCACHSHVTRLWLYQLFNVLRSFGNHLASCYHSSLLSFGLNGLPSLPISPSGPHHGAGGCIHHHAIRHSQDAQEPEVVEDPVGEYRQLIVAQHPFSFAGG